MKLIKLVTLLALLALLAGCNLFLEPENANSGVIGSGFAQVEVRIGGNARTLLPNADFSKYVLSAESADAGYTGEVPSPVEITDEDSGRITLPYGDWIITATAYVNAGGIDYPAAKGSTPITVYQNNNYLEIAINAPESGGTGTFSYKVAYPAGGSASVELRPIGGGAAVVNAASVTNSSTASASVNSGVYFLTVKAIASGKTITRNEVVHIYNMATTEADYTFTKLDFGTGSLRLGGTIKVLVNGVQPVIDVYLRVNGDYISPLNFTGTDGSATWGGNLNDLRGANTLNFRISNNLTGEETDTLTIPVPVDDKTDINLGTFNIEFDTILLTPDTWTNGNFSGNSYYTFYSMNVTQGQTYYLWWNDSGQGDGTKTSDIGVEAYYNNLSSIYFDDNYNAWYEPASFTANSTRTVYLRVGVTNWGSSPYTYAIAYSTDSNYHSAQFDPPKPPVPLAADTWTDGYISVEYDEDWYSINITEGQTYYFWLNNSWDGDGLKTLPAQIYAYRSSGGIIFNSSSAWNYPQSFTANSSGTVYIMVRAYGGWSDTGSYAIKYNYIQKDELVNTVPGSTETMGLTSTAPFYDIVDIPSEDRENVMRINGADCNYAAALYSLADYKDKEVNISFSANVKLIGPEGNLMWQINNNDYPFVGYPVYSAGSDNWYYMSGYITVVPSDVNPRLYLSTYNNSENTIYYISDFTIEIEEVE